tara:strand:+ start:2119 stop:2313 length:195 start_codon:yes stop_codon:yes gene_type:complete
VIKRWYLAIATFLDEVKGELRRTSYPSRKETVGSTGVVLIFAVIMSIFLALVDALLVRIIAIVI